MLHYRVEPTEGRTTPLTNNTASPLVPLPSIRPNPQTPCNVYSIPYAGSRVPRDDVFLGLVSSETETAHSFSDFVDTANLV
jgi:hypothetical protein